MTSEFLFGRLLLQLIPHVLSLLGHTNDDTWKTESQTPLSNFCLQENVWYLIAIMFSQFQAPHRPNANVIFVKTLKFFVSGRCLNPQISRFFGLDFSSSYILVLLKVWIFLLRLTVQELPCSSSQLQKAVNPIYQPWHEVTLNIYQSQAQTEKKRANSFHDVRIVAVLSAECWPFSGVVGGAVAILKSSDMCCCV